MATVEPRPNRSCHHPRNRPCEGCSWRVSWRMGGRNGRKQSTTFASRALAEAANQLCISRRHRITDEEVYRAIHGAEESSAEMPTLAEWADTWVDARRRLGDVQEDTIDHQESVIRRRIVPKLGKTRLTAEHLTPEVIAEQGPWDSRSGKIIVSYGSS